MAQVNAAIAEAVDQAQQAVQGVDEWRQGGQLRTDVAIDADHFQVRQLRGADVHVFGVGNGDAELVLFETGGNVRVGASIDVRVHAQRDRGANAQLGGDHLQALQLVGGFDVEAVHADFQGAAHVVTGLADTGEHDLVGAAAGGQNAFQLATGDDVKTGAQTRQDIQDTQVGVGLDREADQVRHAGQRIGERQVLGFDVGAGVDVGRCAKAFGDGGQGNPFREQLTVTVVKSVHGGSLIGRRRACVPSTAAFARTAPARPGPGFRRAGTAGLFDHRPTQDRHAAREEIRRFMAKSLKMR